MKYEFNEIFEELDLFNDGTCWLRPRKHLKIEETEIGPSIIFQEGVCFGGINFHDFYGYNIEIKKTKFILEIKGFYKSNE